MRFLVRVFWTIWYWLYIGALLTWGGIVQLVMYLRGYRYANHQWVKRG